LQFLIFEHSLSTHSSPLLQSLSFWHPRRQAEVRQKYPLMQWSLML